MIAPDVPPFLRTYLETAQHWLEAGCIGDIEFSDATYQVLIREPGTKHEAWTFLQFDDDNTLRDAFCSCEETSEEEVETITQGCPHLAAAWLRLFHGTNEPLHRRFQRSLWHHLCFLYAEKLGTDPEVLQSESKDTYVAFSAGGKKICTLQGCNTAGRRKLKALLFDRQVATEETSIKFSNLSHEELMLWRTGQPSAELRYELSFWSDLAKWLLWQQEEGNSYTVNFTPVQDSLPNRIYITFPSLKTEFYLAAANLSAIIPSLATVQASLSVVDQRQQGIAAIVYHPDQAALQVVPRDGEETLPIPAAMEGTLSIDDWLYLPNVGFFASAPHSLLSEPWLQGPAIDKLLTNHTLLVQELLTNCSLHPEPVVLSYKLEFDKHWNLQITSYVLEPGDLCEVGAALFGLWAYLVDDGFYRLEEMRFTKPCLQITSEQLPDFIARQRSWLNQQPGFHIHISSLEEQLAYDLDDKGRLSFHQLPQMQAPQGQHRDFGSWFYVAGEGFYAKATPMAGRPVRAGIAVGADQIPLFIRMHAEELHLVRGFFASQCPVIKAGLRLVWAPVGQSDSVKIMPEYQLAPDYPHSNVRFFGEYAYVAGEGFSELPAALRLPESYRQPLLLVGEELERFLTYQLAEVRPLALSIDPRLEIPQPLNLCVQDLALESEAPGWYRAELYFQSPLGTVAAQDVWLALQRKKKYLCSPAGLLILDNEIFTWLRSVRKQRFIDTNSLLLSSLELIRLYALADIPMPTGRQPYALLHDLVDFQQTPPPPLVALKSHLRPYQQLGLQWLWFLYQHGLSGLLCDDMGLGKTHQAMALLDAVLHSPTSGSSHYALVVCPTSVIYHWQDKLHSFLPEVTVHTFYGTARTLELPPNSSGIILTSYGIVRNESERLCTIPFSLAIFDEIQTAKNHRSRIYAALMGIQAHMRLGLTGTPIENHLRELKSLFDLTLPTYLPNERDFRDYFIKPIEKEGDNTRKHLLARLIKPFVLRRRKEEVLTDLPPKIEEKLSCVLLPSQRTLYNEVLAQSRIAVMAQLENEATPIPYLHIFSILSALKQICDHPAVYLKQPDNYLSYTSGKWDLFLELLQEARHSGQKVIVFSHYLAMLQIMAHHLTAHNIGFALLQGATRDRATPVQRFQNDPSCEVFLGSLQAAGTGIDLTAATVVIHYDRWWNAAKERQATDRAYRIGQSRGVQVFKLVTKDTFEERIDDLIASKAQLLEDIVTTDDHQLLKKLDRREILELLKEIDTNRGIANMPVQDDL